MMTKRRRSYIPASPRPTGSWTRDKEVVKWYNSARWRKTSKAFLRNNPLCCTCRDMDKRTPSTVCDHRTPVESGKSPEEKYNIFWNQDNWQPMCASCHNRKSATERNKK